MKNEDILLEENNKLDIKDNSDIVIYLTGKGTTEINIGQNCNVTINHLVIDKTNEITINLNKENSKILYNYSIINYKDHYLKMTINHNSDNTESNVYNHGVNVKTNKLKFDITGIVPKNIKKCICNQENRIININDGISTICPNLLIDSYDIVSSHAAYIGKFNKDILFYLMSRGLNKSKAYELLITSFLLPININKDKVKKFVEELENI